MPDHIFFVDNYMWSLIFVGALIVFLWWLLVCDEGGWTFETEVVHGAQVSRKIDWKTANLLACPPHAKQPGFYSCRTNYGDGTLLRRDTGSECEVHVHDFDQDIYDRPMKLKNIVPLDHLPFKLSMHI